MAWRKSLWALKSVISRDCLFSRIWPAFRFAVVLGLFVSGTWLPFSFCGGGFPVAWPPRPASEFIPGKRDIRSIYSVKQSILVQPVRQEKVDFSRAPPLESGFTADLPSLTLPLFRSKTRTKCELTGRGPNVARRRSGGVARLRRVIAEIEAEAGPAGGPPGDRPARRLPARARLRFRAGRRPRRRRPA